jgi:hypothetical protein
VPSFPSTFDTPTPTPRCFAKPILYTTIILGMLGSLLLSVYTYREWKRVDARVDEVSASSYLAVIPTDRVTAGDDWRPVDTRVAFPPYARSHHPTIIHHRQRK